MDESRKKVSKEERKKEKERERERNKLDQLIKQKAS